ncbi:uncharacterized protein LOC129774587 [Toxorhynchites rutilus septentrionalis]|uniref:uncharacterized protein LOC129774587 n=1 Tax=Toxorhynchites rutilus septentrionalis TaxID=329112 RepID=UPI00247933FC|nr:uncharacterized protein LOC129774587 [Toxorhynchites rutilus septentrionalis]
MKTIQFVFVWLSLAIVTSETIHFTNSAKHLSLRNYTTYEVEVPGSKPITIIEANPIKTNEIPSRPPAIFIQTRNAAGASVHDHAHVVINNGLRSTPTKKTLYSPELLNKFLKEYSEKLKNADSITKQKLNEITMINNSKQFEKQNYDLNSENQTVEAHERHASGSKLYGDILKTHPWNSKDGWVTMQAVPWSESKVSKWQSTSNKFNDNHHHQQPYHGSFQLIDNESEESISRPKPSYAATSPASSSYHGNDDSDEYSDNSFASSRPSYAVAIEKPSKPAFESFYNRRYKPSEDYRRKYSSQNSDYNGDAWYDHGFKKTPQQHTDIITDGRRPYFPQDNFSRPQPTTTDRNLPHSYPERGSGEWVLVSTNKGYQYPRRQGQRAITFSPTALSHKSVKLTVLPMKNTKDMTTSHNGLIEVSASKQTVEQSYNNKIAAPHNHSSTDPLPHRKRRVIPQFSLMRRDSLQDSSAILAAVSAGMVPATLAVVAPMVLGRKRRSVTNEEDLHGTAFIPATLE